MRGSPFGKETLVVTNLSIPENDHDLMQLVCEISERYFFAPFCHMCRYNNRLRTSGGRYLLKSHDLEFNLRYAKAYGMPELVATIKHELCHYHLHLSGRGYRHGDRDFMQLLQKVGGARYARPIQLRSRQTPRYEYVCTDCLQTYMRQRRIDTSQYVCGKCHGKLLLKKDHFVNEG